MFKFRFSGIWSKQGEKRIDFDFSLMMVPLRNKSTTLPTTSILPKLEAACQNPQDQNPKHEIS